MGGISSMLGFAKPVNHRHARLWLGLGAVMVVGVVGGVGPIDAHASTSTDYPMLGYDATHSSVSPDTTVSASGWNGFTLQHKVALGGFVLASPAAAYNTTLGKHIAYVVT